MVGDTGVYQIRNLTNNKLYIGSSEKFDKRWNLHLSQLRRNIHHSIHLQRAWNKYGANIFIFEIIEECESDKCLDREQHHLDTILFASCNDERFSQLGYNICRVAGSTKGLKLDLSKEALTIRQNQGRHLGKINKKLTPKLVKSILDDLLVYHISMQDIAIKYNISKSSIKDIKSNRTWKEVDRSTYYNLSISRAKLTDVTKKKMSLAKRGEGTHLAKLTELQVIKIKIMIAQEVNNHKIATLFNVHHSNISKIRRGKTWRHINDEKKITIPCTSDNYYRYKGTTK